MFLFFLYLVVLNNKFYKMPKTNAEMCRQYRLKRKENKIKIKKNSAKSSTERSREFRARKKQLLNNHNRCSNINVNVTDVINEAGQAFTPNIEVKLPSRIDDGAGLLIPPVKQENDSDFDDYTGDKGTLSPHVKSPHENDNTDDASLLIPVVKLEYESDGDDYTDDASLLIPVVKLEYESDGDDNTESQIKVVIEKEPDDHGPWTIEQSLSTNIETAEYSVENQATLKVFKLSDLPFQLEKDQLDCPVCHETFPNFVSLNTHMNVHYPNYICNSCGKAFASKDRLKDHLRTHRAGVFPCKFCDAVFDNIINKENHVSKEHKSGDVTCNKCNMSLPSLYASQKHLAEVHNEKLKRYKCEACTKSFITPSHLSSHFRRHHLNERNHKCTKCDLAFFNSNGLKMHMIRHDGEKIYSCNVCQKSYSRQKTLKEHMRIHNNDKRFVCPVCGRAFIQNSKLKRHLEVHKRKMELTTEFHSPHTIV